MDTWKIIVLSLLGLIWAVSVVFVAWLTAPPSNSKWLRRE
jgi:hypothetical protein